MSELILIMGLGAEELKLLAERCPNVTGLAFVPKAGGDGDDLSALGHFKRLARLRFDGVKESFSQAQVHSIAKIPGVTDLGFMFPSAVPFDRSMAVSLTNLKGLQVHYKLPAGMIESVTALPSLTSLFFRNLDAFTEDDLKHLSSLSKLTSLNLDGIVKLDDVALSRLLSAMPALETLRIVNCPAITDVSLAALPELKKLTKLVLGKNPGLTDAIFTQCKGIKKLKDLSIKDTAVSDAALASFKKARSDVKVER